MHVGLRFATVLGFLAICGGALAIASRAPQGQPVEQTLPVSSPYYIDSPMYFPPGPESKLQREAAAMKAYKTDLESQQAGRCVDGRCEISR